MEIIETGITIRPDQQHIKELATLTNVSWTSIRGVCDLRDKPPWPNGQGIGLLIQRGCCMSVAMT